MNDTTVMKNRITELFASGKKNILSVYYTAGFPALNDTVTIARALQEAGADIIELGIPFSDPVADGPTIQESNKAALDNGMHLHLLINQVKEIRENGVTIPLILMGYMNPAIQYGMEELCKDAARAGVDGFILPDMPMDVYKEEYKDLFEKYGLNNAFLISPTTSEARIRKIDSLTDGFIYAVSASSTTGAKNEFSKEQLDYFKRLQAMKLDNPFLIGFGISNHATFLKACSYGSGAIVGSAFIKLLQNSKELTTDIKQFVKELKQ